MITDAVDRYVALKRAAGRDFRAEARYLANYAAFAQTRGENHVRTATVLEWARRTGTAPQRRRVLLIVRSFSLTMAVEDLRHEVPPADLLPRSTLVRPKPYIYSPAEILSLLDAADECSPVGCLVSGQYRTLFGLLASTGLRVGEALAINMDDFASDGLMVRPSKFGGWRLLPLHPTAEAKLARYLRKRKLVSVDTAALFLGVRGGRLKHGVAHKVFSLMLVRTGLAGSGERGRNPRIHDFRHTFAVRSLESCGSDPQVIARHKVALSAWLGHVSVVDTYWYLESTEKLMTQIARQTEAFHWEDVR